MREWLPHVNHLFPGSGITPWSVLVLPLEWWVLYAQQAQAHAAEVKKQNQEARRGK